MPRPSTFNWAAYQRRIDDLVGTRDGRPIIMLDWAPDRFRWMPHRLGTDPPGYTFPSFCNSKPLASPDRWALWQRNEPEQYARLWEAGRYARHNGFVWDVKGPCPDEKYTELHVHALHDTDCCPCDGYECKCDDHCWGKYVEPNEPLFDWIRKVHAEAKADPDVAPVTDLRHFEAPHAQKQLLDTAVAADERANTEYDQHSRELQEHWLRNPASITVRETESGLYLIE